MTVDPDNDIRTLISAMTNNYRETGERKSRLQTEFIFGLATVYSGAFPFIIWDADSGLWNPLAVVLCMLIMCIGGIQISLHEAKEK